MGEMVEEVREDLDGDDSLAYQIASEEDKSEYFHGDKQPPIEEQPTEEEQPSEEAKPEEQPKEEVKPDEEPTVDIDGEQVPLSQVKEWKLGYMRTADYTKKTQALAERKRELEKVYGPMSDEDASRIVPEIELPKEAIAPADEGEWDPYDRAKVVGSFENTLRRILDERDKRAETSNRQATYNDIRAKDWSRLEAEHPELQDPNSELYKLANQVLESDPGLEQSPYCNTYAIAMAQSIMGGATLERAKAEGKKELAQQLGERKIAPTTPAGGGDRPSEDILTAEEQELIKIPSHRTVNLSPEKFAKWERAMVKHRRIQINQ